MDLGFTYTISSIFDENWADIKLNSTKGFHSKNWADDSFKASGYKLTIEIDFGETFLWVHQFIIMKRADWVAQANVISEVQFEYFDGTQWLSYKNGEMVPTGQTAEDAKTLQRIVTLTPFYASKVRFISPKEGRNMYLCNGRIEFVVSPFQDISENVKSENDFNSIFQSAATVSNQAIIKRNCTLSLQSQCQIKEMYYKRKDPSVVFEPYSKLLTAWIEGSDNIFHEHFEIYPTIQDAVFEYNFYQFCDFVDSSQLAFGNCGPTIAVLNNAIGQDGNSKLQSYTFSVFVLTKWDHSACTGATLSVNSGSTPGVSINTSNGKMSALATSNSTMDFSLQVNSLTATSNPINVLVFDCKPHITFLNVPQNPKVLVGSVFTTIVVQAVSSSSDCLITEASYALNNTVSVCKSVFSCIKVFSSTVTISSSGSFILDTSGVIPLTFYSVSVVVGSQTIQSRAFSIEVEENLVVDIVEKLLEQPKSSYELQIGQENHLNFGRFQGNDLRIVFVNYQILSTSSANLTDNFTIQSYYKNEQVYLDVDLSLVHPSMVNSTLEGILTISNTATESVKYSFGFSFACTNKEYCEIAITEEGEEEVAEIVEQKIDLENKVANDSNQETQLQNTPSYFEIEEEKELPKLIFKANEPVSFKMKMNSDATLKIKFNQKLRASAQIKEYFQKIKVINQTQFDQNDERILSMIQLQYIKDASADSDPQDQQQNNQIFSHNFKSLDPNGRYFDIQITFQQQATISQEGDHFDTLLVSIKPEVFQRYFRLANNEKIEFDKTRTTEKVSVTIPVQDDERYTDIVASQEKTTNGLIAVSLTNVVLAYLMNSAMSKIWSATNTLQLMSQFALISLVKYPSSTTNMFEAIIKIVTFELVPEEYYEPLKEALLDLESDMPYANEYPFLQFETGFILSSMFTAFVILFVITVLYCVQYLLYICMKHYNICPEFQEKLQAKLVKRHGLYMRFLIESSMEIFVCTLVEVMMRQVSNKYEMISYFTSVLLIILYGWFLSYIKGILRPQNLNKMNNKDFPIFNQRNSALWNELRITRYDAPSYYIFFIGRRLIVAAIIVISPQVGLHPIFQYQMLIYFNLYSAARLKLRRPYLSNGTNMIEFINECYLLFIAYMLYSMAVQVQIGPMASEMKNNIGVGINYIIIALFASNIVYMIIDLFNNVKLKCLKKYKMYEEKLRVRDEVVELQLAQGAQQRQMENEMVVVVQRIIPDQQREEEEVKATQVITQQVQNRPRQEQIRAEIPNQREKTVELRTESIMVPVNPIIIVDQKDAEYQETLEEKHSKQRDLQLENDLDEIDRILNQGNEEIFTINSQNSQVKIEKKEGKKRDNVQRRQKRKKQVPEQQMNKQAPQLNIILEEVENENQEDSLKSSLDQSQEEEKEEQKNIVLDFERFSVVSFDSQNVQADLALSKSAKSVPLQFSDQQQYQIGRTTLKPRSETHRQNKSPQNAANPYQDNLYENEYSTQIQPKEKDQQPHLGHSEKHKAKTDANSQRQKVPPPSLNQIDFIENVDNDFSFGQ